MGCTEVELGQKQASRSSVFVIKITKPLEWLKREVLKLTKAPSERDSITGPESGYE